VLRRSKCKKIVKMLFSDECICVANDEYKLIRSPKGATKQGRRRRRKKKNKSAVYKTTNAPSGAWRRSAAVEGKRKKKDAQPWSRATAKLAGTG